MKPQEYLQREWEELRDGCPEWRIGYIKGGIDALFAVGLLTDEQAELWLRRIKECPGHDNEGGRQWCAYCGDLS